MLLHSCHGDRPKGRRQKKGRERRTETVNLKKKKKHWVRKLTFTPSDFLFSKVLHAERKERRQ